MGNIMKEVRRLGVDNEKDERRRYQLILDRIK